MENKLKIYVQQRNIKKTLNYIHYLKIAKKNSYVKSYSVKDDKKIAHNTENGREKVRIKRWSGKIKNEKMVKIKKC